MVRSHHRSPVHDAITLRHPPIPAPSRVEILRATRQRHYLEQHLKSKDEYTNTQQDLPI
jgi:hypothetical protein